MEAMQALRTVSFLSRASDEALTRLAERSTWRHLARGDFLFHSGDPADRLHVILRGRVAATTTSSNGRLLLFHVAGRARPPGRSTCWSEVATPHRRRP